MPILEEQDAHKAGDGVIDACGVAEARALMNDVIEVDVLCQAVQRVIWIALLVGGVDFGTGLKENVG